MAPWLLFLLAGILITHHTTADADNVLCFATVNENTGECQDLLGDGVSDIVSDKDCCLNIKYGFKLDADSPCVACRVPEWSQWGEWSPCTVSCLQGVQQRERVCIGQGDCEGDQLEVRACSLRDCCPQSGGWSQWSAWSSCSVTCESGQRKRTRQCNSPSPVCGGTCPGKDEEVEVCNTMQVCPTHGQWSNWGSWGQCSSSCIVEGSARIPTQSRFRRCDNPAPSTLPPGNQCPGNNQEFRDCASLPFCPVDGQWGAWQVASQCQVTCGIGRVVQKRSCDSPAPKYGGKYCSGSPNRNTICNTKLPCPIDGTWTNWGEWSECKRLGDRFYKCKDRVGSQVRKRKCVGTAHDGKWCEGDYKDNRNCYYADECPYPQGTWTEWSQWGLCSSPCGQSERKRSMECLPKYPDFPTVVIGETKTVDVFFWGTPKFTCAAIDGETKILEQTEECHNTPPCP